MRLELGPVAAGDMQQWARFARRMICELRVDPGELAGVATEDFLDQCLVFVDRADHDASTGDADFRESYELDDETAEYLLHGFDRCLTSAELSERATADEIARHRHITVHVARALVNGLAGESSCSAHLCDQVRTSLGSLLEA